MSKRKTLNKVKVYKAPVTVGRDNVTITLPKSVIGYLDLQDGEVFWTPVNRVIQISGTQPKMVIPVMTEEEDNFEPHQKQRPTVERE